MKYWKGYGSEHSSNLVIIGDFKTFEDKEKARIQINEIQEKMRKEDYIDDRSEIPEEIKRWCMEENLFIPPYELDQFILCDGFNEKHLYYSNRLVYLTEENDFSVLLRIMINNAAKIQVYSAHDYPDEEYGRGK